MRTERIYLCNSGKIGNKRRSNRSSRTNQITVFHRLPHQLLGNNIHNGKSVFDNSIQFLFHSFFNNFRKNLAIYLMRLVVTDCGKYLIRIRNNGRTLIRSHRINRFNAIRNQIGIGNDNLSCFITSQILEFLQHLFCRTKIQRSLLFILIPLTGLNNSSVNFILRIQEMDITGCTDRFMKCFSDFYNLAI